MMTATRAPMRARCQRLKVKPCEVASCSVFLSVLLDVSDAEDSPDDGNHRGLCAEALTRVQVVTQRSEGRDPHGSHDDDEEHLDSAETLHCRLPVRRRTSQSLIAAPIRAPATKKPRLTTTGRRAGSAPQTASPRRLSA